MFCGSMWLGKDFAFLLTVMLCLLEAKLWYMWTSFDRVEDLPVSQLTVSKH